MKAKNILYKLFYSIFLCSFVVIFGKVLFDDSIHEYDTVFLLVSLVAAVGLVILSYSLLMRYSGVIERYYRIILVIFLSVYGILILVNGFILRFTPTFDMDAVYGGAVQWVQEGTFRNYYEYYGYFPNNLGAMTILHTVFSIASFFGISDFFAVGIIFNTVLLTATILITSLTCRKLRGSVAGDVEKPTYFCGRYGSCPDDWHDD